MPRRVYNGATSSRFERCSVQLLITKSVGRETDFAVSGTSSKAVMICSPCTSTWDRRKLRIKRKLEQRKLEEDFVTRVPWTITVDVDTVSNGRTGHSRRSFPDVGHFSRPNASPMDVRCSLAGEEATSCRMRPRRRHHNGTR